MPTRAAATRDSDDEHVHASSLHPLLQRDLELVKQLVRMKQEHPWLSRIVHATTSHRRTQDLTLALWFVFLVELPELGFPYLWLCVGNLLGVLLLQYFAHIGRPIDVDISLYDRVSVDPDTHGFPCVDSHMAVVVLLPVMQHTSSVAVQLALVLLALSIGVAKLFVATRFASQVLGSYLTGIAGVLMGNHGHAVVQAHRLARGYNTAAIVALIVFLMFVLGTWVENNDSHVLGVPKQDYLDVLGNILQSDTPAIPTAPHAAVHQLPPRAHRGKRHDSEASDMNRSDQQEHTDADNDDGGNDKEEDEHAVAGKRDSFYFLMKAMRARERRRPRDV